MWSCLNEILPFFALTLCSYVELFKRNPAFSPMYPLKKFGVQAHIWSKSFFFFSFSPLLSFFRMPMTILIKLRCLLIRMVHCCYVYSISHRTKWCSVQSWWRRIRRRVSLGHLSRPSCCKLFSVKLPSFLVVGCFELFRDCMHARCK